MSAKTVWCQGEGHTVPDDELLHNLDGSLFKPEMHKVPQLHYCSTGLSHKLPSIPGALLYLSAVAHMLSPAELDDSIKQAASLDDLIERVKRKVGSH